MRAVVLGSDGEPSLADIAEPPPPGELVNVRACGLCGSDVEKIGIAAAGTVLRFADAGTLPVDDVYRRELTVIGSRSATPRHMREAVALLPTLDLPEPTVLPLELFAEGLALHRQGAAFKVVLVP